MSTGQINLSNNCTTTSGNNFIGNYAYTGSTTSRYDINIINGFSGAVSLNQNSKNGRLNFTAQWDTNNEQRYFTGSIGNAYLHAYPGFSVGDKAFVFDIGNGIAVTAADAEGKASKRRLSLCKINNNFLKSSS